MPDVRRFEGKSVIVTGAGSGVGADIARRFSDEGALVVVADVNAKAAADIADELGDAARPFTVDVSKADQVRAMVAFAEQSFGGLDVMVNNAGVHHLFKAALDLPDSEFDRMLNVNVKSALYAAKAAAPALRFRHGSICTVDSIGAVVIRPGAALYAASKNAFISFMKSLALELAPEIRVNCVLPSDAEVGRRMKANVDILPMKRLCTGHDVAGAVAFLSSDDASFITGVALPVDGGRSAGGA